MIFPQPPLRELPIDGSLPWVNWFSSIQKYFKVEAIKAPTLSTNWSNVGGAYKAAGYWLDNATGTVHLTGVIKKSIAGVAGETIFTLPKGYRPSATEIFAIDANSTHGRIDINSSGAVLYQAGTATTSISLSNIAFRV